MTDDDDYMNNILATGMVVAMISMSNSPSLEWVDNDYTADGVATNKVLVKLRDAQSVYRLTVERVPEDETIRAIASLQQIVDDLA